MEGGGGGGSSGPAPAAAAAPATADAVVMLALARAYAELGEAPDMAVVGRLACAPSLREAVVHGVAPAAGHAAGAARKSNLLAQARIEREVAADAAAAELQRARVPAVMGDSRTLLTPAEAAAAAELRGIESRVASAASGAPGLGAAEEFAARGVVDGLLHATADRRASSLDAIDFRGAGGAAAAAASIGDYARAARAFACALTELEVKMESEVKKAEMEAAAAGGGGGGGSAPDSLTPSQISVLDAAANLTDTITAFFAASRGGLFLPSRLALHTVHPANEAAARAFHALFLALDTATVEAYRSARELAFVQTAAAAGGNFVIDTPLVNVLRQLRATLLHRIVVHGRESIGEAQWAGCFPAQHTILGLSSLMSDSAVGIAARLVASGGDVIRDGELQAALAAPDLGAAASVLAADPMRLALDGGLAAHPTFSQAVYARKKDGTARATGVEEALADIARDGLESAAAAGAAGAYSDFVTTKKASQLGTAAGRAAARVAAAAAREATTAERGPEVVQWFWAGDQVLGVRRDGTTAKVGSVTVHTRAAAFPAEKLRLGAAVRAAVDAEWAALVSETRVTVDAELKTGGAAVRALLNRTLAPASRVAVLRAKKPKAAAAAAAAAAIAATEDAAPAADLSAMLESMIAELSAAPAPAPAPEESLLAMMAGPSGIAELGGGGGGIANPEDDGAADAEQGAKHDADADAEDEAPARPTPKGRKRRATTPPPEAPRKRRGGAGPRAAAARRAESERLEAAFEAAGGGPAEAAEHPRRAAGARLDAMLVAAAEVEVDEARTAADDVETEVEVDAEVEAEVAAAVAGAAAAAAAAEMEIEAGGAGGGGPSGHAERAGAPDLDIDHSNPFFRPLGAVPADWRPRTAAELKAAHVDGRATGTAIASARRALEPLLSAQRGMRGARLRKAVDEEARDAIAGIRAAAEEDAAAPAPEAAAAEERDAELEAILARAPAAELPMSRFATPAAPSRASPAELDALLTVGRDAAEIDAAASLSAFATPRSMFATPVAARGGGGTFSLFATPARGGGGPSGDAQRGGGMRSPQRIDAASLAAALARHGFQVAK